MLLDTDVFSYLMKPREPRAALYKRHVEGAVIAVSFVTVGEIFFGARKKKWGAARLADLDQRLKSVVVVPYDREICVTYGELKAQVQEKGRPVADNDLWIASCAVRHRIPLVSNNRSHYEHIPVLVLISEAQAAAEISSQRVLDLAGDASTPEARAPRLSNSLSDPSEE